MRLAITSTFSMDTSSTITRYWQLLYLVYTSPIRRLCFIFSPRISISVSLLSRGRKPLFRSVRVNNMMKALFLSLLRRLSSRRKICLKVS